MYHTATRNPDPNRVMCQLTRRGESSTYEDGPHKPREVALEIRFDVSGVERGGYDTLVAVPSCQL